VKAFVLVVLSALLPGAVFGAPSKDEASFFARSWLAEDGLADNRVVGLAQTPDGYLWVATQGGVVRFDGVRFQRVILAGAPELLAGTMRILMLDRGGQIWVAKEEGGTVFCFEGAQVRLLTPDKDSPRNETQRSMALDSEGGLLIAYNTGRVIRYGTEGKAKVFAPDSGLPAEGVCWLTCARDGTPWFAKAGRVGIFREGRFTVLNTFASAELRIAPAHSGGIWVCAGPQLIRLKEGADPVETARIVLPEGRDRSSGDPSVLLEDRAGAVWIGTTSAGLFRCDSNVVGKVEVSNPAILSLAEDREGNLWVGTRGGGLNCVRRRLTSMIRPADGLPFEGVQSVCEDAAGALWLVGENGVLARGRGTNWIVQSPSGSLVQTHATCVAADTNGSVWIGSSGGGLYRWSEGQFRDLGLQASLRRKSPRSLQVMANGDLWIGTDSPDVLYRLRGESLQTLSLPPGRRFIRAMAEDASGNLWAGASDGLLVRISPDAVVAETARFSSFSVRCLHVAANGDLWIGYAGAGVGRLRDGQFSRFSSEQGLPNDYVAQILTDDRDRVWFGGNQGLFQVRERDFDDVTQGVAPRVLPVIYGRSEGMPGLQASFDFCPSSLCSSDGRLYFSMLTGLAEVRVDQTRLNYWPPTVLIERVTADDQTLALYKGFHLTTSTNRAASMELSSPRDKRELKLPPGVQQVRFELAALSFISPENVQLRYQLEGLDENWVEAGTRRVAIYTHPRPGHYHFKVTACNNDGIWNKVGDELAVDFQPYFWEALWFKLLMTLASFTALCGTVVLVLRRRHRLVVERLEHQRALDLERTRIARDLHDDLGVGLTEIGLLGDLAASSGELHPGGREHVQEITSRARTLAASLDEIVWAINPANDTSHSLVDYFFPYAQKLLGRAGIRCRLEVIEPFPCGSLNAEKRHEFFHAYKEALNNVLRHSSATQVQITLSASEGNLLIRIADNGRGLEGGAGRGAHHGLAGMRERLLRLGGRCEIVSRAGEGTTVIFIVPVPSEIQS